MLRSSICTFWQNWNVILLNLQRILNYLYSYIKFICVVSVNVKLKVKVKVNLPLFLIKHSVI